MEDKMITERILELIIKGTFDTLSGKEREDLSKLLKGHKGEAFFEELTKDRDKLIDFITIYASENVNVDEEKLKIAKVAFDKAIRII